MVSKIFYFHPYEGKISNLTIILFRWRNHQPATAIRFFSKVFQQFLLWPSRYRIQLCYRVIWKVKCGIIYPYINYTYLLVSGNVPKYLRCNLEKGWKRGTLPAVWWHNWNSRSGPTLPQHIRVCSFVMNPQQLVICKQIGKFMRRCCTVS